MTKHTLLCDANFCVLPILSYLKKQNHTVSVTGSLLSDPGHHLADISVPIDYSDITLLHKHITEHSYDNIVPGCNDRSYMSLAEVGETLGGIPGFDSFETASIIHHKDKFRTYAEQHNYPIPKAILSPNDNHLIKFPVMVKPVDSFSGKGINKAHNKEELITYWAEAKKFSIHGKVIAEEFIEGKLFSHSAFIKNKKIIVDFFVNEYCTVYPYQVNSSNVSTKLNAYVKEGLREWTEQFAESLDLCDGLIHTQFISDNNAFSLIEITRRCPGDLYSQLIEKSTGINYAALYAMPFCGLALPDNLEEQKTKYISRHTVSVDEECIFISSSLDIEHLSLQNIQLKYSGEPMQAAPFDKSGIFLVEHKNKKIMEDTTEIMKDYVVLETLDLNMDIGKIEK